MDIMERFTISSLYCTPPSLLTQVCVKVTSSGSPPLLDQHDCLAEGIAVTLSLTNQSLAGDKGLALSLTYKFLEGGKVVTHSLAHHSLAGYQGCYSFPDAPVSSRMSGGLFIPDTPVPGRRQGGYSSPEAPVPGDKGVTDHWHGRG